MTWTETFVNQANRAFQRNGWLPGFLLLTLVHSTFASALVQELGFRFRSGSSSLVVASVAPSSAAFQAKFQSGDIILDIEGKTVSFPKDFETKIDSYVPGSLLKVGVGRATQQIGLRLRLPLNLQETSNLTLVNGTIKTREGGIWKDFLTNQDLAKFVKVLPKPDFEGTHWGSMGYFDVGSTPDGGVVLFNVVSSGTMNLSWTGGVDIHTGRLVFFSQYFGTRLWSPSRTRLVIISPVGESGFEELALFDWTAKRMVGLIKPMDLPEIEEIDGTLIKEVSWNEPDSEVTFKAESFEIRASFTGKILGIRRLGDQTPKNPGDSEGSED